MRTHFGRRFTFFTIVVALALLSSPTDAQQPPNTPTSAASSRVELTAGRSTVLASDFDITRIAVTNPNVADATVVQPREILIDGKAPGTITLIVWGGNNRTQYDVVVSAAVSSLQQQLAQLFPGEDIHVSMNEETVILSGNVSTNAIMLRAGEIAEATSTKSGVINMLQLPGGSESQQVLLQVRFAEVNRRALQELGVSIFTSAIGFKNTWGRSTTQQFSAPDFENLSSKKAGGELTEVTGEMTFSDFLNLFFLSPKYDIGAAIRALKSSGVFQSLAEPNLIAYNGQEASFLAGGEFPVPVVQGTTGAVSIQFKEFGIRLNFRPTIAGDVIRLRVRPEVSSLDFANGVTLGGFAIAGLLDNMSQEDSAAIPILSKLPIIGALFKSKATRAARTELMVLITPRLVRPLDPDEVPALPTKPGSFLPSENIGGELQGGGGTADAPKVP
jgi:pilus assembly protein CpaC